ncbi:MAG: hypothetical protein PHP04_15870 [Bacteroidales bacterium]|nr:hypothetical protein [Bacteroidales bacterium]
MNWQLYLTLLIIATATVITIRRTLRFFKSPPEHCQGCTKAQGSCSLLKLKEEIKSRS